MILSADYEQKRIIIRALRMVPHMDYSEDKRRPEQIYFDPASKEVCVLFKLYRHPPSMSCGKCVSRAPGDWGA